MDKRAKRHIHIARCPPHHYMVFAEPWSVWTQGKKEGKTYWTQKDDITEEVLESIN
jgi:hypothetical protein